MVYQAMSVKFQTDENVRNKLDLQADLSDSAMVADKSTFT